MLRLTLIRHAQAAPAHAGQEDWDRALEASGQRDAHEMGRRLKSRDCRPDLVLSSPAARALATAQILARELGISGSKVQQDERLYLASAKDLQKVAHELGGDVEHLMVVGHNPGLTEFADALSSERSIDNLPTCAAYSLDFEIAHWSELEWSTGVDAEFDYPRSSG
jgi:phosphohistidine phosphatase